MSTLTGKTHAKTRFSPLFFGCCCCCNFVELRYSSYGTGATVQKLRYRSYGTAATVQEPRYRSYNTGARVQELRYRSYGTEATVQEPLGGTWFGSLGPQLYNPNIHNILANIKKYLQILTQTHTLQKRDVFSPQRRSACGKPETPQVGLGDTNPYKNAINTNKYGLHIN